MGIRIARRSTPILTISGTAASQHRASKPQLCNPGATPDKLPMSYSLTAKREQFCQLVAAGTTYTDAYLDAYQKPAGSDRKLAAEEGSRLMANTDIILRVQELRRPVIRKFQRKYEYTLNKALEECEIAWNLACAQSDPRAMLKAIELRGKFVKLLTNQPDIIRRHGLLDDASTEVLLAMKKAFEDRTRAKVASARIVGNGTGNDSSETP